jgi:hypothetical protein
MGTPLNAEQIRVGGNGTLWTAPVGTTLPTTPTAAPAAAWLKLGYLTDAGGTITRPIETTPIRGWQAMTPLRMLITSRDVVGAFELLQWSQDTVKLAFGGGTVSNPSAGVYKWVPPAPETVDYRAFMLDWIDGSLNYRWIVPKGLVTDFGGTTIARTDAAILPITFTAIPVVGQDSDNLLTDDPSWSS